MKIISHLNGEMYDEVVVEGITKAKRYLLIATANVKNMMVRTGVKNYRSVIDILASFCKQGGEVKILHSGKPSGPFLDAVHRHPELESENFDMRQCIRNHMKIVSIDGEAVYFGSANLTGAGMGLRNQRRHNFEVGVLAHDEETVQDLEDIFYGIWGGGMCRRCGLRTKCPLPIDTLETD